MPKISPLFVFILGCLFLQSAYASDPWTPVEGQGSAFTSYVYENFDEFWRGTASADFPPGESDQHTASLGFSYGLLDELALDATLGYTQSHADGLGSEDGLNDTMLGVRWRFLDEFEYEDWYVPSLAVALRTIIAGTYDTDGFPIAPGDGAHGIEYSLLMGNLIGDSDFGTLGEVGMRLREGSVPEDFFFSVGVFQTVYESVTLSVEYRHEQALSGIDLGTPDFSPERARELDQHYSVFEFGLGYTEPTTEFYVGAFYGITIDGKNTGKKDIVGVSASLPFSL